MKDSHIDNDMEIDQWKFMNIGGGASFCLHLKTALRRSAVTRLGGGVRFGCSSFGNQWLVFAMVENWEGGLSWLHLKTALLKVRGCYSWQYPLLATHQLTAIRKGMDNTNDNTPLDVFVEGDCVIARVSIKKLKHSKTNRKFDGYWH